MYGMRRWFTEGERRRVGLLRRPDPLRIVGGAARTRGVETAAPRVGPAQVRRVRLGGSPYAAA